MNLNFDLFVLFWTMLHYKAFVELWQRWHNFAREENRKTWNALKGNALKSVCFGGCVVLKITPKKSQPKKVVLKRITSNETNDVHHDFAERVFVCYRKWSSVGLILTDEFEWAGSVIAFNCTAVWYDIYRYMYDSVTGYAGYASAVFFVHLLWSLSS